MTGDSFNLCFCVIITIYFDYITQNLIYFTANRNSNLSSGRSENNDPSPTTNQLAQWFSPDLLERARGGELPSTAGLAQHVISLEEIERQTAPPVHN